MCVLPLSISLTAFRIINRYVFSVLIVICEDTRVEDGLSARSL